MMQRELLLLLAVVDLCFSYLLFTGQQYFSAVSMVITLMLPLLALVLFILPFRPMAEGPRGMALAIASVLASVLLICASLLLNGLGSSAVSTATRVLLLMGIAVSLSVAGLYAAGAASRLTSKWPKPASCAVIAAILLVTAAAAYLSQYGLNSYPNWSGIDENEFNYYASYLVLHGHNPYAQSMQPILLQRNIAPPALINGTYDYTYGYPALSFLAYVPATALGLDSPLVFAAILIFLAILASFAVYRASGFNNAMLLPLALWLGFSYFMGGITNAYLSVSVLLVFAYLSREKPLLSGALLGLAASTAQVSWFALPFFYAVAFRDRGIRGAALQAGASALVFLLMNAYFIAASPAAALGNMLSFFHGKEVFAGTSIVQFTETFYPVPYLYSTIVPAFALVLSLALLYLYGRSARMLLAVAPMMAFFLAWRNMTVYGLAYVALALAVYADGAGSGVKETDLLKDNRVAILSVALLAVSVPALAVLMHGPYASAGLLHVNGIVPVIYVVGNGYAIGGLMINVTNGAASAQNVTFYIFSSSPGSETHIQASALPSVGPMSSRVYSLNYTLPGVNDSTRIFALALNRNYIASGRLDLSLRSG